MSPLELRSDGEWFFYAGVVFSMLECSDGARNARNRYMVSGKELASQNQPSTKLAAKKIGSSGCDSGDSVLYARGIKIQNLEILNKKK